MKTSELMIGNWYSWEAEGKIYYYQVTKETFSLPDDDIFNFQPVPLTPKILEKNGFTHSFGDSDFYDYEKWEKKADDKTIRVIKDHVGWFCRVDDNKLTRSMGIAPAVHTMQNIIRIGGIEKQIEL